LTYIMSFDTVTNAFSTLRAEKSGKTSNSEVVLDFTLDPFTCVLAFAGLTNRYVESTFLWNGVFRRPSGTTQVATIQDATPAGIQWSGIPIPLRNVQAVQSSTALHLSSLRKEAADLRKTIEELEGELEFSRALPKIQAREKSLGKETELLARIRRLEEDLSFCSLMLSKKEKNSKPGLEILKAPILSTGKSKVVIKYLCDKPLDAQHIQYFADAHQRTKTWDGLVIRAPISCFEKVSKETNELRLNKKGCPIPCAMSKDAIKLVENAQKVHGEFAPRVGASHWKPVEMANYAHFMCIVAYNHTWGSMGLVPQPKLKLDRRFIKKVETATRKREPVTQGDFIRRSDLDTALQAAVQNALKGMLPAPAPDEDDSDDLKRLNPHLKRIHEAYVNSQDVCRRPKATAAQRYRALFVIDTVTKLSDELDNVGNPLAIFDEWASVLCGGSTTYDVLNAYVSQDSEIHNGHGKRWGQVDSLRTFFDRDHIKSGEEQVRCEQDALLALAKQEEKDNRAKQVEANREIDRKIAEGVTTNHAKCGVDTDPDSEYLEKYYCSHLCPKLIAEEDLGGSSSPQGVMSVLEDDREAYEDVPVVALEDPSIHPPQAGPSSQKEPDSITLSRPQSRSSVGLGPDSDWGDEDPAMIMRSGLWFHKLSLVEEQVQTGLAPLTDLIAPTNGAFLTIFSEGVPYVHLGNAVLMPSGTEDKPIGGLKPLPTDRRRSDVEASLNYVDPAVLDDVKAIDSTWKIPALHLAGVPPKPEVPSRPYTAAEKGKAKAVMPPPTKASDEPSSPPKEVTKKKNKKSRKAEESAPLVDYDVTTPHVAKGKGASDPSATLDGKKKGEWIAEHTSASIPRSDDTQQAGCVCDGYPCRHTKTDVSSKIRSAKDQAWNLAYLAAGGKLSTSADGKAGGSKKPGKQSPEETKNPLRVKNLPRSKMLSNEDRIALRKHFSLKDELPEAEWSALSKEDRIEWTRENSIPRWASAIVMRNHDNLKRLLDGKLSKDQATALLKKPEPRDKSSCSIEWTALKSRFNGVSLLSNPRSGQQKALKKAYDALARKYPGNPCLPKPRKAGKDEPSGKPEKKGTPPSQPSSGGSDIDKLIKVMMLKMMGSIAKD